MVRRILLIGTIAACGGAGTVLGDGGVPDGSMSDGAMDASNDSSNGDTGNGNDSGNDADSGGWGDAGSLFPCGSPSTMCDSKTQYCHLQEVGPQPADGGFTGSATCLNYPGTCGSSPSCSCIPVVVMCSCSQSGADITDKCGGV
jgi:hypothetical protein